jgi:CubicO group peptidase (beta-lactamase class C family)
MVDLQLHGHVDERFAPVGDALLEKLNDGTECGVSLVVDIDGESVVDVYGGFADGARTRPWQPDTIVNVWSTTKTVTSLAALMLVDRGLLDVDEPVATYWPDFAANGKDKVLVRHLLGHTSGVSGWDQPFAYSDMYDWETSTARLAAQAPWWEPGTAAGYHAHTFGHLIGEVIRRITGKTLKQFVEDEIAGPLDADFQIGVRQQDWPRCAELIAPPPLPLDLEEAGPDSILVKTLLGADPNPLAPHEPGWRLADIGAANGHGNAASVARIMSGISLGGTTHGVRLLSPETIELIFREQAHGVDMFLGIPIRWGIGYALPDPAGVTFVPEGRVCFWGGWGGSMIIMDLDRRMTISYMMNTMKLGTIGSEAAGIYTDAIYRCADGRVPQPTLAH